MAGITKVDSFSLIHVEDFDEAKELLSKVGGKTGIDALITVIREKRRKQVGMLDRSIYALVAATGAGKSTFMVYHLFDEFLRGRNGRKTLICTQPKIAQAQNNAIGVQNIFGNKITLGKDIGYRTGALRLEPTDSINILYCTTRVLTNRMESLEARVFGITHPIIVIDEAHDQSVEMEGLMKTVKKYINVNYLNDWCPLFIITSATIYPPTYISYFGANPMLTHNSGYISGSTRFPIEEEYITLDKNSDGQEIVDTDHYILKKVKETGLEVANLDSGKEEDGGHPTHFDILNFFPTVAFTKKLNAALIDDGLDLPNGWKYHPLSLASADVRTQSPSFKKAYGEPSEKEVRVISATPLVETGATFPHLRTAIDSATVGTMVPFPLLGMSAFIIGVISEYSRIQRKGRVGRTGPGKYVIMCTEETKDALKTNPSSSTLINSSIPSVLYNMVAAETMEQFGQEIQKAGDLARYLAVDRIGRKLPPIEFMEEVDLLDPISMEMYIASLFRLQKLGLLDHRGGLTGMGIQTAYRPNAGLAEIFLYSELMDGMFYPIDIEIMIGVCYFSFRGAEIGKNIEWSLAAATYMKGITLGPKEKRAHVKDMIRLFVKVQEVMEELSKGDIDLELDSDPDFEIRLIVDLIDNVVSRASLNLVKSHYYAKPYLDCDVERKRRLEEKLLQGLMTTESKMMGPKYAAVTTESRSSVPNYI